MYVCIVVSSLPCEIMGHVGATKYETSNFQRCCCQSGSSCANADRASHSLTHPEFKCLKRSWIRNRKNSPSGRVEHGSACDTYKTDSGTDGRFLVHSFSQSEHNGPVS